MPYGRNVLVDDWNIDHPLYNLMEETVLDCDAFGEIASMYGCSYVVLRDEQEKIGDLITYGYTLIEVIDGYQLYYNDEIFQAIYK